jgi:hypothetical protein
VAVACVLRVFRGQNADVASAHLVARRARSGADGRLGHPGRRAAENGRLRLSALLAADVSPSECRFHWVWSLAVDGRGGLHLAGRAGAARYEKADRLFLGRAHGVCDDRAVHVQPQGIEGAIIVMLSHGLVSGALFLCVGVIYDRLHTREISRYGGLQHQYAQICAVVHAVHDGERRLAGHQRFCGRVS